MKEAQDDAYSNQQDDAYYHYFHSIDHESFQPLRECPYARWSVAATWSCESLPGAR